MITLEICANSAASAVAAAEGGADRVELCENMADGGTTPSYGSLLAARDKARLLLYPIIRPRGGDFLYDDREFDIMCRDIELCKKAGCDGVVIGVLAPEGNVDTERTRLLADLAWPLGVTFHRAFDRCRDPLAALEEVIRAGCERILTSGQRPTAMEGAALIATLREKAAGRIAIMAGSGVRPHNIAELVRLTGCTEYHSTAQTTRESAMRYRDGLAGELAAQELHWPVTDPRLVEALRRNAEAVAQS